jgi:hypothetical protein
VRIDAQFLDRLVSSVFPALAVPTGRPDHLTSERPLKEMDDLHCDRKYHLLVELRIPLGRRQSVLRKKMRIVKIDRLVKLATGRIDVDDFEILVDRTDLQLVFPWLLPW